MHQRKINRDFCLNSLQICLLDGKIYINFISETIMSISMYQASIPPLVHSLANLKDILDKAVAHTEAKKIDPAVLVNARLYPDMFPLVRQIMIATDVAKGGASRLAGLTPPKYEDNETTFAELIARINKTIVHLETFTSAQIDGTEDNTIKVDPNFQTVN